MKEVVKDLQKSELIEAEPQLLMTTSQMSHQVQLLAYRNGKTQISTHSVSSINKAASYSLHEL